MVMPQGSRAQVASPVLLHSDLASTPLFEDTEDALDVVIFDTTVEYLPRRTRTRTALNTDTHVQNLKKQLLEGKDQLVPAGDVSLGDDDTTEQGARRLALAHNCYEMPVELESPGQEQPAGMAASAIYRYPTAHHESHIGSVFRAFKCIEGQESPPPRDAHFLPLEVQRPHGPRQSSSGRPPSGYSLLPQRITIDY